MFQATRFDKADVRILIGSINSAAKEPMSAERLSKTFDLCWPGLLSEVEQIDLSAAHEPVDDDEDEDGSDTSYFRDELEEEILTIIAGLGEDYPSAEYLSAQIGESLVKTQYCIDRLLVSELLHGFYSVMAPARYMLTATGRAYLVENDLV